VRGLRRVNLGCGPHYAEGWTNVDRWDSATIADGRTPDLICDVRHLPWRAETCSHVYMGHLIEHLSIDRDAPAVLSEARRLLALDGELMVVGPDIARAEAGWPEMVSAIEPGVGDELLPEGIPHKWAPTEASALELCASVFPAARAVAIETVGAPWPLVDPVGWQFAIRCPR